MRRLYTGGAFRCSDFGVVLRGEIATYSSPACSSEIRHVLVSLMQTTQGQLPMRLVSRSGPDLCLSLRSELSTLSTQILWRKALFFNLSNTSNNSCRSRGRSKPIYSFCNLVAPFNHACRRPTRMKKSLTLFICV